jgi:preprotein translocase subunit Sss1
MENIATIKMRKEENIKGCRRFLKELKGPAWPELKVKSS